MGILPPGMEINWLPDIDVKVDCSSEVAKYVVYMLSQNKQSFSHDGIYLKQEVTIQIYCFVFDFFSGQLSHPFTRRNNFYIAVSKRSSIAHLYEIVMEVLKGPLSSLNL